MRWFALLNLVLGIGARDVTRPQEEVVGKRISPPQELGPRRICRPVERLPSTYVLGDLHGDAENFLTILGKLRLAHFDKKTKSFFWDGGQSYLVQLGDVADRGPAAPLIYEIFRQLKEQTPNIMLLFGNHEIFNMCNILNYVNPQELSLFYPKGGRREDWSPTGDLGRWIRKNLQVMDLHRNHFILVHGGLNPNYSTFSPKVLKKALLDRVDRQHCFRSQGAMPFSRDLGSITGGDFDILFGKKSPLNYRTLSLEKEEVACGRLELSLQAARTSWIADEEAKQRKALPGVVRSHSPLVMLVGHTPTHLVPGNHGPRIGARCPKEDGASSLHQYFLTDVGISGWVNNNMRLLKISGQRFSDGAQNLCVYKLWEIHIKPDEPSPHDMTSRLLAQFSTRDSPCP